MPAYPLRHKFFVLLTRGDCDTEVDVTHLLKVDLIGVVPATIVEVLSKELICTLNIPFVGMRHVDIIDEENLMLLPWWPNQGLRLLL